MTRISDIDLERHIASTDFELPWKAVPSGRRLQQWYVVADGAPGRGKTLIADDIRTEGQAQAIAAAPDAFAELKALRAVMARAVHCLSTPQAYSLADLTTILHDAAALGFTEFAPPGQ